MELELQKGHNQALCQHGQPIGNDGVPNVNVEELFIVLNSCGFLLTECEIEIEQDENRSDEERAEESYGLVGVIVEEVRRDIIAAEVRGKQVFAGIVICE